MASREIKEYGAQPLDALMSELGVETQALVAASDAHLTHKQVGKARRGRRLTTRMQIKVRDALNSLVLVPRTLEDLFTYRGG